MTHYTFVRVISLDDTSMHDQKSRKSARVGMLRTTIDHFIKSEMTDESHLDNNN